MAPWATAKKFTSWSFSRWSLYNLCPYQAKLKNLDKVPEPAKPAGAGETALERGDRIHKAVQGYILLPGRQVVPKELKPVEDLIKGMRARYRADPENVVVEETWAYRRDWSETTFNDWTGCWLRIKMDATEIDVGEGEVTIRPTDWKTGKFSPQYNLQEYMLQTELYAVGALHRFKDSNKKVTVVPRLVYTDHGIIYPEPKDARVYTLADLKPLTKQWEARVRPMMNDTAFKPTPNSKCGWCPYNRQKGGPCVY